MPPGSARLASRAAFALARVVAQQHFLIIGGGIVGLATAIKLARRLPDARITILEKEPGVGRHRHAQQRRAALRPLLQARLAQTTRRQRRRGDDAVLPRARHPHDVCGKLVVAVDDTEVARLKDLQTRGAERTRRPALAWPGADARDRAARRGIAALHVPQEGIVDYAKVCATMMG